MEKQTQLEDMESGMALESIPNRGLTLGRVALLSLSGLLFIMSLLAPLMVSVDEKIMRSTAGMKIADQDFSGWASVPLGILAVVVTCCAVTFVNERTALPWTLSNWTCFVLLLVNLIYSLLVCGERIVAISTWVGCMTLVQLLIASGFSPVSDNHLRQAILGADKTGKE